MTADPSPPAVIAVAPRDPLAPGTFSGYSARLFGSMRRHGIEVQPLASRRLRWWDLPAALNLAGLARGRVSGRYAPRIRPDWYWSRAGFERFSRRLQTRLVGLAEAPVLQVGTHVRVGQPGAGAYCVTDCTVVQALEGGEFSISQTSPRVADQAVACQHEVFAACAKVFTLSRWAAASVVADYGIPAERVVVVGAGANLAEPVERRPDPARPLLLFVGRDWQQKGGPLLLEAFGLLRGGLPALRLAVVGCSPALRDPGVEVVGYLPGGDPDARRRLADLYARASCLVLPSRFDCFPNVLLEAQLAGVPVVTLAGQGRPEALADGRTGRLVHQERPEALAAAVQEVLDDERGPRRMSPAARRLAEERFTWPAVVDRVLAEMGVPAPPHQQVPG
ncbi:MAG TPA: glycosyltransferase family 4 protein [Actinomycetes bacterium]|nr:glycosyltransferase family 4 protein [Actinomycetes bacterium]